MVITLLNTYFIIYSKNTIIKTVINFKNLLQHSENFQSRSFSNLQIFVNVFKWNLYVLGPVNEAKQKSDFQEKAGGSGKKKKKD